MTHAHLTTMSAQRRTKSTFHRLAILIVSTVICLLVAGCGPEDGNFSLSAHSELDAATLEVTRPAEYSDATNPALEYVSCSDPDVTLHTEDVVDTSKVGVQTVTIEMSKGFFNRTEQVEIPVQDTASPQIELTESNFELEVGYDFDPAEHVANVSDPVDGDLQAVEEEPEPQQANEQEPTTRSLTTDGEDEATDQQSDSASDTLADDSLPGMSEAYEEGWYTLTSDVDTTKAGTYTMQVLATDQHGNTTSEDMTVVVTDPLDGVELTPQPEVEFLEYGTAPIDPTSLVTCSDDETTVTADSLTPDQVGATKATYHLAKHKSTRDVEVPFTVRDTQGPALRLRQWKINIQMGEAFDPKSYVKYAKDPVDGKLAYVDKPPATKATDVGNEQFYDKGFYYTEGTVDTSKPGTYRVDITAYDKHGNTIAKHLRVRVIDPLAKVKLTPTTEVLEYSHKSVDPTKLVNCSVKGAKVTADKLDLSRTGEAKVAYTITKGHSTHKADVTFTIRDTKAPTIALTSDEATIEEGGSFDLNDYLTSVADPVDGELSHVDSAPDDNGEGWYTVDGTYDRWSAGRYFMTITACDRHGNRTSKEFALTVQEPATSVSSAGSGSGNAHSYVLNTNTYKFHYPSCRDVNRIKDYNRWDVSMTRDEVIGMGYSPCGHCNP